MTEPGRHGTEGGGRVLLLEDEPAQRTRLVRVLRGLGYADDRLAIADHVAAGLTAAKPMGLALALVDLGLPDGNGVELIRWLRPRDPDLPILVISAWNTEEMILEALRAGATGYLLKERDDLEIELSIRSALRGGAPIDPFIARRILSLSGSPMAGTPVPAERVDTVLRESLTEREFGILGLVARGMSNQEIAQSLSLSRHTVETHIKRIYGKLAVHSRTQAVHEARSLGLIQ